MNAEQRYMDGIIADLEDARHRVDELAEENAVLREKLKRVSLSFVVIDEKTGKEADVGKIAKEDWASNLMRYDIEGFAIMESGNLALLDECGNWAYCPPDRFDVIFGESDYDGTKES